MYENMATKTCYCTSSLASSMQPHSGTLWLQKGFAKTFHQNLKVSMLLLFIFKRVLHPCFSTSFCAQTPCTIKSNTFNQRMLKPEEKDKIRTVTERDNEPTVHCRRRGMPGFIYGTFTSAERWWRSRGGLTYTVSIAAELPEGLDVEPGALVPSWVQRNPHGVLLEQRRQTLVHGQKLVALNVEELGEKIWTRKGQRQREDGRKKQKYSNNEAEKLLFVQVFALIK